MAKRIKGHCAKCKGIIHYGNGWGWWPPKGLFCIPCWEAEPKTGPPWTPTEIEAINRIKNL